jgi:hypothetical protein
MRDQEVNPPAARGRGRRPKRPWQRVDQWSAALPADAWTTIDVRDGAKGPLVVDLVKRRVVARTPQRQEGHAEMMVVSRYRERDSDKVVKVDFYLSNAEPETPLGAFARVAKAEHRIEECLQRSKSEAGLADYEVRHWTGWHQASNTVVHGHVVPGDGNPSGNKNGRPRSHDRRFATASR